MSINAPETEQILMERANAIAGACLNDIATELKLLVPKDLTRNKGWVGILLERYLGADAGSKALQDFRLLGIELKTLPISSDMKPLETTFVCLAPLTKNIGVIWETSHVKHKLAKVLWIPVEGDRKIPLAQRRVGQPILWQPSIIQIQQLRLDWEELMEYIVLGKVSKIHAGLGKYLHLRPKAANNKETVIAIDESGKTIMTNPLGFYLRKDFTQQIIDDFLN